MSSKNGSRSASHAPSSFRVEVAGKPGYEGAAGAQVAAQFAHLGMALPAEVRVCPIYEFTGRLTPREVEQAAKDLLADPVTQEFRVGESGMSPAFMMAPHWRVEVWLKPSVSDPHESSVRKALKDLGLPAPERVRCGTVYKIVGRLSAAQVERAARKILSNPVIHRYVITTP